MRFRSRSRTRARAFPPENLERIFERFYTDRPQESFGQNSGLGLNISRQIVVAHGGASVGGEPSP